MPRFSIVTITRNHRAGLASTAASLQMQTCPDYEWIIIDGASTDGTREDFPRYPAARIISEPDNGIYDAMNKGLDHCTGDYVIFMNAGDQFASPDVLHIVADSTLSGANLIYGDALEDGHIKKARRADTILWGMFTHHQAIFYNRRALDKLRYDLNYKIAADYDLTLRFLTQHPVTQYVSFPVCIFETGGISQRQAARGRQEQYISRARHHACSPLKNRWITFVQTLAGTLRAHAAPLYWTLRFFLFTAFINIDAQNR